MPVSLRVAVAASVLFVALLIASFAVGDISDDAWTALGVSVVVSAIVALAAFVRYFVNDRPRRPAGP